MRDVRNQFDNAVSSTLETRQLLVQVGEGIGKIPAAATISIDKQDPQQTFEGIGTSASLYVGNWRSLGKSAESQAAQLAAVDLPLQWLKAYVGDMETGNFRELDKFIEVFNSLNQAKRAAGQAPLKAMLNFAAIPSTLGVPYDKDDSAEEKREKKKKINTKVKDVYKKLGEHWFHIIEHAYQQEVTVDYIELMNEQGVSLRDARRFTQSLDHLNELLDQAGIPRPQVVGPSTWGVEGAISWLRFLKNGVRSSGRSLTAAEKKEARQAWENIDIVATHGYNNGWVESKYRQLTGLADGKPVWNTEQTAKLQVNGNAKSPLTKLFPTDQVPGHGQSVATALRVSDAANGGVSQFAPFLLNTPKEDKVSALVQTKGKKEVATGRFYAAFKQLLTKTGQSTTVLASEVDLKVDGSLANRTHRQTRALAFGDPQDGDLYVHVTNVQDKPKTFYLEVPGYQIEAYAVWETDEDAVDELADQDSFDTAQERLPVKVEPLSVTTFKLSVVQEGEAPEGSTGKPAPTVPNDPEPTAPSAGRSDPQQGKSSSGTENSFCQEDAEEILTAFRSKAQQILQDWYAFLKQ